MVGHRRKVHGRSGCGRLQSLPVASHLYRWDEPYGSQGISVPNAVNPPEENGATDTWLGLLVRGERRRGSNGRGDGATGLASVGVLGVQGAGQGVAHVGGGRGGGRSADRHPERPAQLRGWGRCGQGVSHGPRRGPGVHFGWRGGEELASGIRRRAEGDQGNRNYLPPPRSLARQGLGKCWLAQGLCEGHAVSWHCTIDN